MAAEALEQSVLESKDKEQLLAIAKALGVKATTRTRKADIISLILETTNASDGRDTGAGAADTANGAGKASNGDGVDDADRSADATANGPSSPHQPTLGSSATFSTTGRADEGAQSSVPDEPEEPPAEWEQLAAGAASQSTADSTTSADPAPAATAAPSRQPATGAGEPSATGSTNGRTGTAGDAPTRRDSGTSADSGASAPSERRQQNGASRQPGDQQSRDQQSRDRQSGDQQSGDRQSGDQQSGDQQGGDDQQAQQGDGESRSRRRRRRRKGKGNREDGSDGAAERELDDDSADQTSNSPVSVEGYLDMREEGYGFLRLNGYLPSREDSYVPVRMTRQYGLRKGDHVTGISRPPQRNEKNPALLEVHTVNGESADQNAKRARFEDLTALFPDQKLRLEDTSDPTNMTARIIDLVSPIGKGQRGIIVSPPKAGKTTVMKTIARSIERNNPEVKLIVLLIDERPEEVTDMRRSVQGEVIASTFDRPSEQHTQVAEMTIEKAKRMVERGDDVVVILDGITRLSRAYNLAAPASGRILSGGIDAGALYPPKKFFGAARNVEEAGSLTILATALVETNSRMDEAIFEEFKGTGNMELRLDRKLSERRIFPSIDVDASSTRHEELLFDRKELQQVWKLRRVLSGLAAEGNAAPGLELLIDRLKTFRTNAEFLDEIGKQ